ncbi:MAG: carbon monoxide dehydrogenase [Betaproteobacteria bacterium HGW-Betaproteobacteria-3]|nr:MAG: carbon monoxide dehydrogenase [Betaproteobacteria bacterium HGW-Betaproteobacteria-3]
MIPPTFEYHAPRSLGEAVELLTSMNGDAKLLAGGHSLLPMMKMRFAQPGVLIDIHRIPELRGISEADGQIRIGAMTTESELISSVLLKQELPLVPEAALLIADPQVRNRGTIGGDIAHGDPGNDHPAIAMALDATFVLQGPKGERQVKAVEFFHGTYMTELAEDEILTAILVSSFAAGTGYAYQKLKRKTGDWATAGAAVVLRMNGGRVTEARIGLTNVAPTALRARDAEAALIGQSLTDATLDAVVKAVRGVCDPAEDLRGNVEYKTAMAAEMTRRAIRVAAARCH